MRDCEHWLKRTIRRTTFTAEELTARGQEVFTGLYGDNAENVHNLLHDIYPDMGKPHCSCFQDTELI